MNPPARVTKHSQALGLAHLRPLTRQDLTFVRIERAVVDPRRTTHDAGAFRGPAQPLSLRPCPASPARLDQPYEVEQLRVTSDVSSVVASWACGASSAGAKRQSAGDDHRRCCA